MPYFIRFGDPPVSGRSLCYAEEAIRDHCEKSGYPLYEADSDDERNVRLEASGCTQRYIDGQLVETGISVCYSELIDDDLYEFDTHSYSRRDFRDVIIIQDGQPVARITEASLTHLPQGTPKAVRQLTSSEMALPIVKFVPFYGNFQGEAFLPDLPPNKALYLGNTIRVQDKADDSGLSFAQRERRDRRARQGKS